MSIEAGKEVAAQDKRSIGENRVLGSGIMEEDGEAVNVRLGHGLARIWS